MLQKYADIIIDISHEAIDRPFQYRIPEKLEPEIQTGTMVKIPFGRGNQVRTGYVIGISRQPELPPEKIKEILDICDKSVSGGREAVGACRMDSGNVWFDDDKCN